MSTSVWFNPIFGKCYKITTKGGGVYIYKDNQDIIKDFEEIELSACDVVEVPCEDVNGAMGWQVTNKSVPGT